MYSVLYFALIMVCFFSHLFGMTQPTLVTLQFTDTVNGSFVTKQYSVDIIKNLETVSLMLKDCGGIQSDSSIDMKCTKSQFKKMVPFLKALNEGKTKDECAKSLHNSLLGSNNNKIFTLLDFIKFDNYFNIHRNEDKGIEAVCGVDIAVQMMTKNLDDYIDTFNKNTNATEFFKKLIELSDNKSEFYLSDNLHSKIIECMKTSVPDFKIVESKQDTFKYSPRRKYKVNLKSGEVIQCSDNKVVLTIDTSGFNFSFDDTFLSYYFVKKEEQKSINSVCIVQMSDGKVIGTVKGINAHFGTNNMVYLNKDHKTQISIFLQRYKTISENFFKIKQNGENTTLVPYKCSLNHDVFTINQGTTCCVLYKNIDKFFVCDKTNTIFLFTDKDDLGIPRTIDNDLGITFIVVPLKRDGSCVIYPSVNYILKEINADVSDSTKNEIGIFQIKDDQLCLVGTIADGVSKLYGVSKLLSNQPRLIDNEKKLFFIKTQSGFSNPTTRDGWYDRTNLWCYNLEKGESNKILEDVSDFIVHPTENILIVLSNSGILKIYDYNEVSNYNQGKILFSHSSIRKDSRDKLIKNSSMVFDKDNKFFVFEEDNNNHDSFFDYYKFYTDISVVNIFTGKLCLRFPAIKSKVWYDKNFEYLFDKESGDFLFKPLDEIDNGKTQRIGFNYPETVFHAVLLALAHVHKWNSVKQFPKWLQLLISNNNLTTKVNDFCAINQKIQNLIPSRGMSYTKVGICGFSVFAILLLCKHFYFK